MDDIQRAEQVCVILDIWSRKGLSESYLGVLIRYFDHKSSTVKMALIGLRKMIGSHTAVNVYTTLHSVLNDWNIPEEKVGYNVTDNGSNVVKALEECIIEYVPMSESELTEDVDDTELFEERDPNLDASFMKEEVDSDLSN